MNSHISDPPQAVGLIGAGLLGSALAERLLRQQQPVLGFDIDVNRQAALAEIGAVPASSADQIFQQCRMIVLSLPDSRVAGSVLLPRKKFLRGQLIIDTTTGAPEDAVCFGQHVHAHQAEYLDATVVGSSEQARQGDVTVLVGGTYEAWAAAAPLLSLFSSRQFHLGPCGTGATAKLIVNLVLGLNRAVLAEALNLAKHCGMNLPQLLEILTGSAAYSRVMDVKGQRMISADFNPQARLAQHAKDVDLIVELGQRTHSNLPLSTLHQTLLQQAVDRGYGHLDNSAIIRVFEESQDE